MFRSNSADNIRGEDPASPSSNIWQQWRKAHRPIQDPFEEERVPLLNETSQEASHTTLLSMPPIEDNNRDAENLQGNSSGNTQNELTEEVQRQIDQVRSLTDGLIGKLIGRGAQIQDLKKSADELGDVSSMFRKRTTKAKRDEWAKSYKTNFLYWICTITAFIVMITLILWFFNYVLIGPNRRVVGPTPTPYPIGSTPVGTVPGQSGLNPTAPYYSYYPPPVQYCFPNYQGSPPPAPVLPPPQPQAPPRPSAVSQPIGKSSIAKKI